MTVHPRCRCATSRIAVIGSGSCWDQRSAAAPTAVGDRGNEMPFWGILNEILQRLHAFRIVIRLGRSVNALKACSFPGCEKPGSRKATAHSASHLPAGLSFAATQPAQSHTSRRTSRGRNEWPSRRTCIVCQCPLARWEPECAGPRADVCAVTGKALTWNTTQSGRLSSGCARCTRMDSARIGLQVSCERKEIRTRYGKEFSGQPVTNILRRVVNSAPTQSRVTDQRAFADLNAGAFSLLVRDHRARLRELPTAALHLGEWHRLVALVLLGLFLVGILVKAFKLIAHPYIPSVHSAVIRGRHDVHNAVEVHVFLF
jgi:hypothetical protein